MPIFIFQFIKINKLLLQQSSGQIALGYSRRVCSGAPKFVEPSLPRHAPINKPMRACTDRGQCACVQPLNRLCVSARAAKSSWTHKVCVLSTRLCAQLRGKGQARARIYAPRCALRGREASLWRVRASHRNPYSFSSFFFLCLSLLDEQYVIAVEKNRPMNFSKAFIVMHGREQEGMFNKLSFILLRDFGYRYKLYTRNCWNILCSHFVKYAWKKYFINIT